MFEKLRAKVSSIIGPNSNNNTVIQNSTVNNPMIICNSGTSELLNTLGKLGQYDLIQENIMAILNSAKATHPLYPTFSAKYNPELERLISTAETEDAFEKYPKKMKGTFKIDYADYPHMDRSEKPWEYAYRTQTEVEVETTDYKEYLGESEDPFPLVKFVDGMKMVIIPHEFPEAREAILVSGEIEIPIMLRRLPCFEYGKILMGNISTGHSFDLRLRSEKGKTSIAVTIEKNNDGDFIAQLQREKLIDSMKRTKRVAIRIDGMPEISYTINDEDLQLDMFKVAPILVKYIESLLTIEKHLNCRFPMSIPNKLEIEEYKTAILMAFSLEEKWYSERKNFDNKLRCDYDSIMLDVDALPNNDRYYSEAKLKKITLNGLEFTADKLIVVYFDARINNAASIKKNIKRKRKGILITMRPKSQDGYFVKHSMFEGLKLLES